MSFIKYALSNIYFKENCSSCKICGEYIVNRSRKEFTAHELLMVVKSKISSGERRSRSADGDYCEDGNGRGKNQ